MVRLFFLSIYEYLLDVDLKKKHFVIWICYLLALPSGDIITIYGWLEKKGKKDIKINMVKIPHAKSTFYNNGNLS